MKKENEWVTTVFSFNFEINKSKTVEFDMEMFERLNDLFCGELDSFHTYPDRSCITLFTEEKITDIEEIENIVNKVYKEVMECFPHLGVENV